ERARLARWLRLNGCECRTAADGLYALDFLATHEKPDLLLLGGWMRCCDGRQTVERIRGDRRFQGLKLFAVGTKPEGADFRTAADGIDGWLPKPLDSRICWETIRSRFNFSSGVD